MLFRFENPSCYQLNGPKVYEIDKDSKKPYSFSTKIFSLLFPPEDEFKHICGSF